MEVLQLVLSLCGILGLIFFMFFFLKKLQKGGNRLFQGNRLKVIDRIVVGRDTAIVVLSVCEKLMLISISPTKVEKLSELSMSEEEYLSIEQTQEKKTFTFSEVLGKLLNKDDKNQES
ncbi:MAG: flagellar biosynthetic protein FliO [Oscillospiraceae bacterium]|nr:flagellar biosynthetic protein FliO [Oscillospiraceae bacterium]